jgi:predicted AAA+ superfamily ATPase
MGDIIDWLETAGLIYRVQIVNQGKSPLSAYSKESFFKLYLFDVGILNALSGLSPTEILNYNFGTFKGYLLENFVLQSMVSLFGKKIYSWNEGSAEIDFVREVNGINIPIEVKSGINLKAKSLSQYITKYSPQRALRFSLLSRDHKLSSGVVQDYPLYLAGESSVWLTPVKTIDS